ncbi:uncharacterized protein LOC129801949 [Phlebotomus papatasi]|uniref:Uncharacterized protein n=1 Tax=Phlebotomus papatasi TaxID=29031 RepID=A0A1B0D0X9_PHLPP|nr:uncharacterized protein LOC129801949 [Phlebotomus papatasi]
MKIVAALLLCALVVLAVAVDDESLRDHTNGQPGCRTQEELDRRFWRNNFDPTRFWECTTLNQAASAVTCEEHTGQVGLAWFDERQECVDWSEWQHTMPVAPPSRP